MRVFKSLQFKFAGGLQGRFTGTAASFSSVPDRQGDIIVPGAFAATLKDWRARGGMIPLLLQHNQYEPVGSAEAEETDDGLEIEGRLADGLERAEYALRLLQTGALSMSIGYEVRPGGARLRDDGVRELLDLDLFEVSLVSVPADPRAVVRQVKADIRSFEAAARDALGLSSREAKRLAAGGYAALVRDEPPQPDIHGASIVEALTRIAYLKG